MNSAGGEGARTLGCSSGDHWDWVRQRQRWWWLHLRMPPGSRLAALVSSVAGGHASQLEEPQLETDVVDISDSIEDLVLGAIDNASGHISTSAWDQDGEGKGRFDNGHSLLGSDSPDTLHILGSFLQSEGTVSAQTFRTAMSRLMSWCSETAGPITNNNNSHEFCSASYCCLWYCLIFPIPYMESFPHIF